MNSIITLVVVSVVLMLSEVLGLKRGQRFIALAGLATALATGIAEWNSPGTLFDGMLAVNDFSNYFGALLITATFVWMLIFPGYMPERKSQNDYLVLLIFALIGGLMMVSFQNLIVLFLGIEILSIPMFVLAGSNKLRLDSNEAAIKYLLMGAFATGFLLFGIALIYGFTGTFDVTQIHDSLSAAPAVNTLLITGGITMLLIGLFFKTSAVPFHYWAPDVYSGSPTPVTAFMSTIVKTAAVAGFLKLFSGSFGAVAGSWSHVIAIASALTILLGNIGAIVQSGVKRMLAYSSVAHAGYLLMAIAAANTYSASAVFFYSAAYVLASLTAFGVLAVVSAGNHDLGFNGLRGLFRQQPVLALSLSMAMLSLAGIPPLAGFFGKYYVFLSAFRENLIFLVIIGLIGSATGVYYYLKVMIESLKPGNEVIHPVSSPVVTIALTITALASLVLGIWPAILSGLLN